jgi:hypothetical protein
MKAFLNKYIEKILIIFLYLQPVIDLFTSISLNIFHLSISFGIIIRFLFLLFLLYFYLFVKKDISSKKRTYLIIVLFYILSFALMINFIKDSSALSYELQNLIKFLYFPILLTIIPYKNIKINYLDLVKIGFIYLLFIAIPSILGLGFNSYTQGKIGCVGWFNSGNEISAILSLLTPFMIYYLFTDNKWYKKIILIILICYTYFIIGSKIIVLSLIISVIFNIILFIKTNKIAKNKIYFGLGTVILLIVSGIYLIPKTNFYYNMVIHLNYLGIHSFKDIFTYNFINRFIFSDRLTYLNSTNLNYIWSKPIEKILGLGFIESFGTDYVYIKAIEMDIFDIFYRTGIVGTIIILWPIIYSLKSLKLKSNILENKELKFSIIFGFIISTIVGHTLSSPGVSIYLLYMIAILNNNLTKDKKVLK